MRFGPLYPGAAGADAIDAQLHAERVADGAQRHHAAALGELPDGAFVLREGAPWLVRGEALLRWTPGGCAERAARPARTDAVLITPPSLVAVLRAGWDGAVPAAASVGELSLDPRTCRRVPPGRQAVRLAGPQGEPGWPSSTLWGLVNAAAREEARAMATNLDPATFARAIMLDAADIPPDMTIAEWRMQREPSGRSGRRWRWRRKRSARLELLRRPAAPQLLRDDA